MLLGTLRMPLWAHKALKGQSLIAQILRPLWASQGPQGLLGNVCVFVAVGRLCSIVFFSFAARSDRNNICTAIVSLILERALQ